MRLAKKQRREWKSEILKRKGRIFGNLGAEAKAAPFLLFDHSFLCVAF